MTDVKSPVCIAFNSREEMVVCAHDVECRQIAIFDIRGRRIRSFGSHGGSPEQMNYPAGIAVDDMDNIYVSSQHKLQKFTSSGELIKCVGQMGSKEGEFNDPRGVTLYNNQVYVCDSDNHRIQVFDLDLNFIRSIGSHGTGIQRGELEFPCDVGFDRYGYMYVAHSDWGGVPVLDRDGHFVRVFDVEGELTNPTSIVVVDKYVYVCDCRTNGIRVYKTSGELVTELFGGLDFDLLIYITTCANGRMYVCDSEDIFQIV